MSRLFVFNKLVLDKNEINYFSEQFYVCIRKAVLDGWEHRDLRKKKKKKQLYTKSYV